MLNIRNGSKNNRRGWLSMIHETLFYWTGFTTFWLLMVCIIWCIVYLFMSYAFNTTVAAFKIYYRSIYLLITIDGKRKKGKFKDKNGKWYEIIEVEDGQ